eukprot:scaffold1214_cov349-Prasinococcus_capsulatus_cf.AAC.6
MGRRAAPAQPVGQATTDLQVATPADRRELQRRATAPQGSELPQSIGQSPSMHVQPARWRNE